MTKKYLPILAVAEAAGRSRVGILKLIREGKITGAVKCPCGNGCLIPVSEIKKIPPNRRVKSYGVVK